MIPAIELAESIRTNASAKLLRTISSERMHNNLNDLFVDRTAIDTSLRRFLNRDALLKVITYNDCLNLNDERTMEFNKHFSQVDCDIDENNNMFIARDGGVE